MGIKGLSVLNAAPGGHGHVHTAAASTYRPGAEHGTAVPQYHPAAHPPPYAGAGIWPGFRHHAAKHMAVMAHHPAAMPPHMDAPPPGMWGMRPSPSSAAASMIGMKGLKRLQGLPWQEEEECTLEEDPVRWWCAAACLGVTEAFTCRGMA